MKTALPSLLRKVTVIFALIGKEKEEGTEHP